MADYNQLIRENYEKKIKRGLSPTGTPMVGKLGRVKKYKYREPEEMVADFQRQDAEDRNFLGNWDYRNPERRGPQGEALPRDALSWTPNGEPYYGDGLPGWWAGFKSRLLTPAGEEYQGFEVEKTLVKPTPYAPGKEREVMDIFATLKNAWNSVAETETPIGAAFRGTQEVVKGGIEALGAPAKATEQALGVGQAISDVERQKQIAGGEIRTPYGHMVRPEDDQWEQYFKKFSPPETSWDTSNLKKTAEMGWQAGRIFYSSSLDPMLREEFYKRYQAGENPYFLQQELENPAAELVGQMVFDPLNLVGMGITKPLARAMTERKVLKLFFTASDEVTDVLRATDGLSEAGAAGGLTRAVDAQIRASQRVAGGLSDLTMPLGGRSLRTSTAKQFVLGQESGELLGWLTHNHTPDDALEAMHAMVKMASDNADEVAEGLTFLRKGKVLAPQAMVSEVGNRTGVILRRMLTDADGNVNAAKFFEDLAKAADGSADEVVRLAASKMDQAVGEMFPSVEQMRTAAQKLKGGRQMTSAERQWAAQYNRLSPGVKAVAAVGERMSKAYRVPNSFFSGVYMGYSPGYAARNFSQDSLLLAIDQGPDALFIRDAVGKTKNLLAGVVPAGVRGISGGTVGVEVLAGTKKAAPMLLAAEKIEEFHAGQVVYASVRRTLRKAWQPGRALPELRPLVDAGLSPEAARRYAGMIWENGGDVTKATAAFVDQLKTGDVDLFRTLDVFDKKTRDALEAFNKSDEVLDIMRTSQTPEEAANKLDEIWDAMRKEGDGVANELPAIDETSDIGQEALTSDLPSDEVRKLSTNYYQAMDNALTAHADAVYEHTRDIPELHTLYNQTKQATAALKSQARDFGDKWNRIWDKIKAKKSLKDPIDIPALWREMGMEGSAPEDWNDLRKAFWNDFYFPKQHEYYGQMRGLWETATETVKKRVGDNPMFQAAEQASILSRQHDTRLIPFHQLQNDVEIALLRGQKPEAFAMIARQFGADVTDEAGKIIYPKLKNTLNKYLPEGQKIERVEDLTAEQVREIFSRRLEAKTLEGTERVAKAKTISKEKYLNFASKPRGEIDPTVSAALEEEAGNMLSQIEVGEPGKRLFSEETGKFERAVGSSYPKWYGDIAKKAGGREAVIKALDKIIADKGLDKGKTVEMLKRVGLDALSREDPRVMLSLGDEVGAFNVLVSEIERDVDLVSKYGYDEAVKYYQFVDDFDLEEAVARIELPRREPLPFEPIPTPHAPSRLPTPARVLHESRAGLDDLLGTLKQVVTDNWGRTAPTGIDRNIEKAINDWAKGATKGVAESRLLAANVADADRAFTLLSYPDKTYVDLALGFVYPYQFWYNRTYINWIKRVATDPQVLAGYAKYREYLEKIHAGAPEWWKYNINSDEVLGIQTDNPLFFNLEATLNPLNGVTGVDFTDPYKRVNWWTKTLDDLNKLGPSTFTPFSMAAALALKMQNEDDAAARWGGRLFPQTAPLKSALNKLNINIPTGEGIDEFDPMVQLFSGGIDPYERKRVARALGWMIEEGEISQAKGDQAAYEQTGPIYMEALKRAIRSRADGQLFSFFLGTGFKARSTSDIQIDRMDSEWRTLWNRSDDLSPDEMRKAMEGLRLKYPFMDAVLMARKGGDQRDRSYAYNVMGRIPPGQKDDIFKLVDIDPRLYDKFYETKGDMSTWSATDKSRYMAGIVDIGAILDLPDTATRAEWERARTEYSDMLEVGKQIFGEDIWDRVDSYYAAKGSGMQRLRAEGMLEADPQIAEAMTWRDGQYIANPYLQPYYATLDKVEKYYNGLMYDAAEKRFGPDIFDIQNGYFVAKLEGREKEYLKQNPKLLEYWDDKDDMERLFAQATVRIAQYLKEPVFPELLTDEGLSFEQQDLLEAMQQQEDTVYQYTWNDWRNMMSEPLERLVLDYAYTGRELSTAGRDQVEYMAGQMDIDPDILLELMSEAAQGQ